jgi:hypothetical protein
MLELAAMDLHNLSDQTYNRISWASVVVATIVGLAATVLAVDGNKAMYVGGTRTDIKEASEGKLDVNSDTEVAFTPDKTKVRHTIAYKDVTELEYGQKAGRRVAVGLLVSPLALFSKKRNHYLTISFKDEAGKDQAVVFELGKDIVRTTLAVIEARTGKKIEYQDDEARKSGRGGH